MSKNTLLALVFLYFVLLAVYPGAWWVLLLWMIGGAVVGQLTKKWFRD